MQETWTFDFPNSDQLEDDLILLIETNAKELGIFLSFYYKKEGALAEMVKLKSKPKFESPTSGKLILEFNLAYFNACLGINEQEKDEMKIDFNIDLNSQKVTFIGAFWPSREMDEI